MQNKIIPRKQTGASKGILTDFALRSKNVFVSGLTGLMLSTPLYAMGPNPSNSFGNTGIGDPCEKASSPLAPKILYVPVVQNYMLNGYSIGSQMQIAEPTAQLNSLFETPGAFNDATKAKNFYGSGQGPAFIREINKKAILDNPQMKNLLKKGITNYNINLTAPQLFNILHFGNKTPLNENSNWDAKFNGLSVIVMSAQVEQIDLYAKYEGNKVTAYEQVKTSILNIPAIDINAALKTPAGLFYLGVAGTFENNSINNFSVPAKFCLYATQSHLYDKNGGVDSSIYLRLESIKAVFDEYVKLNEGSAFLSIGDFFTRFMAGIRYLNAKPNYAFGISTNFAYLTGNDYDINALGNWMRQHVNPYMAVVYFTPAEIENMHLKDGMLDLRAGVAYKISNMFGVSADVSYFPLQKLENTAELSAYLRFLARF
ncbi:hypothetical protein COU37_05000 [Candidatus Micrarchaeota archaeon CG10_big_fil_rev_8_21_14_0_10_45_29]|nr:MAG: hypothetical protein COU37_05000 [Candidatus Micrarchaeota archaeon CG10_big_fil_rev_8_21_14_0_10_45_29]